ncbi:MAG: hypothetical protein JWO25_232 [Alphaproteobacteria bacterium]|nr:hypothetical protein [Alphaproteobacteria bacterium]
MAVIQVEINGGQTASCADDPRAGQAEASLASSARRGTPGGTDVSEGGSDDRT